MFTTKELEKWPELIVEPFPYDVKELRQRGQEEWINVDPKFRDLCEETLEKIRNRAARRRLNLKTEFRMYDK